MSQSNPLILHVHLDDAGSYEIGDEIWQQPLADAIRAEAEIIAECASLDLLQSPDCAGRDALRDRAVAEMTAALRQAGDTYTAPDGIAYTLTDQAQLDLTAGEDTLAPMSLSTPVVEEVLRFADLPIGSAATRAAILRWSDGTESQALAWYSDLCGCPHKSPYAESRVMPRAVGIAAERRGTAPKARHNRTG